ncbi:MAG: hypothetical protein IJ759_03415 [Bacteroidales bacterium]|nr:hypothetical protein [Bacteroidales bacterium]
MLVVTEDNFPNGLKKYLSLAEKGEDVRFKKGNNLFFKIVPVFQETTEEETDPTCMTKEEF